MDDVQNGGKLRVFTSKDGVVEIMRTSAEESWVPGHDHRSDANDHLLWYLQSGRMLNGGNNEVLSNIGVVRRAKPKTIRNRLI